MTEKEVEQFAAQVFQELGVPQDAEISNTLFIDGDRCLAIAFHADGYNAVWCFEDGQVEFHDAGGNLLRTVRLADSLHTVSPIAAVCVNPADPTVQSCPQG